MALGGVPYMTVVVPTVVPRIFKEVEDDDLLQKKTSDWLIFFGWWGGKI